MAQRSMIHGLSCGSAGQFLSVELLSSILLGGMSVLIYKNGSSWPVYTKTCALQYTFMDPDHYLWTYSLELVSDTWRTLFSLIGKLFNALAKGFL